MRVFPTAYVSVLWIGLLTDLLALIPKIGRPPLSEPPRE